MGRMATASKNAQMKTWMQMVMTLSRAHLHLACCEHILLQTSRRWRNHSFGLSPATFGRLELLTLQFHPNTWQREGTSILIKAFHYAFHASYAHEQTNDLQMLLRLSSSLTYFESKHSSSILMQSDMLCMDHAHRTILVADAGIFLPGASIRALTSLESKGHCCRGARGRVQIALLLCTTCDLL